MERKEETSGRYRACDYIPKTEFAYKVSDEVTKALEQKFDLPPLYEEVKHKRAFIHHYSFNNNRNLLCRWAEYKTNFHTKKPMPYQLPSITDLHFHNQTIRYRPDTSNPDYRRKLKPGPGDDNFGQLPIPHEFSMKRVKAGTVEPVTVKTKTAGKGHEKKRGKVLGVTK